MADPGTEAELSGPSTVLPHDHEEWTSPVPRGARKPERPRFRRLGQREPLSALIDELASGEHGPIMCMGKGGVGKTTLAAVVGGTG